MTKYCRSSEKIYYLKVKCVIFVPLISTSLIPGESFPPAFPLISTADMKPDMKLTLWLPDGTTKKNTCSSVVTILSCGRKNVTWFHAFRSPPKKRTKKGTGKTSTTMRRLGLVVIAISESKVKLHKCFSL